MSNKTEALTVRGESFDYVKQYVDACAESADRARFILIVMITASVLTFVTTWNSRSESWLNGRMKVAGAALNLFDPTTKMRLKDDDETLLKFFQAQPEIAKRAQNLVNVRGFHDRDHLLEYVRRLEIVRTEQVLMVRVPFFGIIFDINDIGMFAGFTFAVVLLLFRFSLSRELNNLKLAFAEAKSKPEKLLTYDMLSMQQVLTVPPKRGKSYEDFLSKVRLFFWANIPKLLFILPFLVQLRVFAHDWRTYDIGRITDPHNAEIGLKMNVAFLVVIFGLTALCVFLSAKIDKTWRDEALALRAAVTPGLT